MRIMYASDCRKPGPRRGNILHCPSKWGFLKLGVPLRGFPEVEYNNWGSLSGSPYFGKLANFPLWHHAKICGVSIGGGLVEGGAGEGMTLFVEGLSRLMAWEPIASGCLVSELYCL